VFFGAGFKNIISLSLLLIVLLFFPKGLFGGFAKKT
jgi:branched-chain amino acid transport system permease protein